MTPQEGGRRSPSTSLFSFLICGSPMDHAGHRWLSPPGSLTSSHQDRAVLERIEVVGPAGAAVVSGTGEAHRCHNAVSQVGPSEVRTFQIRVIQNHVLNDRAAQVGILQVRLHQVRATEVCIAKVRALEVGWTPESISATTTRE